MRKRALAVGVWFAIVITGALAAPHLGTPWQYLLGYLCGQAALALPRLVSGDESI